MHTKNVLNDLNDLSDHMITLFGDTFSKQGFKTACHRFGF